MYVDCSYFVDPVYDFFSPFPMNRSFRFQVRILEYKSIICSGFKAVMHINAAAEEVEIRGLHSTIDPKTGQLPLNTLIQIVLKSGCK